MLESDGAINNISWENGQSTEKLACHTDVKINATYFFSLFSIIDEILLSIFPLLFSLI